MYETGRYLKPALFRVDVPNMIDTAAIEYTYLTRSSLLLVFLYINNV